MTDKTKIKCPFCDWVFTDEDFADAENDLYRIAITEMGVTEICPLCENQFFIEGGYSPEYETFKSHWEMET